MRAALAFLALVNAAPALADVEAKFLDGTYVMADEACEKLKALEAGGTPSLNTVPWSVNRKGFEFWEGGCEFSKITEKKGGKTWVVTAQCSDGPEETTETYTFVKNDNGTFAVTLEGEKEARTYTRCDVKQTK